MGKPYSNTKLSKNQLKNIISRKQHKLDISIDKHKRLVYKYQAIESERARWASLINSLACVIINGEISSNDIDLANDAIELVLPYLEAGVDYSKASLEMIDG